MKKRVWVAVAVLVCVLAAVAVGTYCGVVRQHAKEYDLVTLRAEDLPAKQESVEDAYIQLSEVRMHYVRYGEGAQPVILIHGNGGSCESLSELAAYLATDYSVYCLDSRCQGQSSDPGAITYDLMAKDVWEFINAKLAYKPFVLGHSDGGIVALTLAAEYPDSVAAVVSCGANSHPSTFKWYFTWGVKIANLFHKDKLNDLMLTLPDFTPAFLAAIRVPTYVVAGEYDIMPLSDSVYISEHIAGSLLSIVKGAGHSGYVSKHGGQIYGLAHPFFAGQAQCVPYEKGEE